MKNAASWTRALHDHRRRQQRGVAAIAMALLSLGVSGAGLVSFMLTRAQDGHSQVLNQSQVLAWADKAVRDFALANGRLPCPAAAPNGEEDCSNLAGTSAKGWLPVASLSDAQHDGRGSARITYLVSLGQEGAGSLTDLSASTAAFLPRLENGLPQTNYPGYAGPPAEFPSGQSAIRGTMDICAKLVMLRGGWQVHLEQTQLNGAPVATVVPERWRIAADNTVAPGAPVLSANLAYGVAVAAQGAPAAASSSNADFGLQQMESPSRPRDAQYQDMVKITGPAELYDAFGCAGAIASLDTMLVAHAWSGVNEGNRQGGIKFAGRVIEISRLGLAADTIGLTTQMAEQANALFNNSGNVVKLAQAQANFLFEWPFIPVHIAGIAQASAGAAMTVIDMAISAAAMAVDVIYMQGYGAAKDTLESFTVWTGGRGMLEQVHELGIP
ncbi:MAG: hypothetical protein AB7S86_15675, partial [Hydrogenophaga sp.]